jgi:muramoyltetrapeptide carboxypeptidase
VSPKTASGLLKFRPVRAGSRVALVAPASGFDRAQFDAGVAELERLGLQPVWEGSVFDRAPMTAGKPRVRVDSLQRGFDELDADAVIAVRGGYGSVELLPHLDADRIRRSRTAFVGYSDVTSVHTFLAGMVGLASVYGAMIDGRIAVGSAAYDSATFLKSLSDEPIGELAPAGLQTLMPGVAAGPIFGGTITQILAAIGTPYEFQPPAGHVLLLEEIKERPYRLHRMLMQLRLAGRLTRAAAVIFGQMPGCDEPGGEISARDVIIDVLQGFGGPVLMGFPAGHATSPLLSIPLGVRTVVIGHPSNPRVVVEEAAAA